MIRKQDLYSSVRHALRGVSIVFKAEQSFRIQAFGAACAIVAATFFRISTYQFLIVLLLIGAVLTLEIVNTIFERLADSFQPRVNPIVRDIKDIMAGAVLIASMVSLTVGIVIFWPYLAASVL